jgi:hypothetical protein
MRLRCWQTTARWMALSTVFPSKRQPHVLREQRRRLAGDGRHVASVQGFITEPAFELDDPFHGRLAPSAHMNEAPD